MAQTTRLSAWRRGFLLMVALILIVSVLAACGKKKEEDTVIATYKGGQVTESEFNKYVAFYSMFDQTFAMYVTIPEAKEHYLKEYIGYKVLFDKASQEDKDAASANLDAFVKQYEDALVDNESLKKSTEEAGLKSDDVRQFYQQIVTIRKYWERNVTEDEMKAEFEKNKTGYNKVTVRHILIATMDLSTGAEKRKDEEALKIAKEVKQKLDDGGDWKALAAEYSEDTGSKDNGGLYENESPNSWVEAFKQAAITQPIGVIGDPVKTDYGYHVIKVESREDKKYEELADDTKTDVQTAAITTKMEAFMSNEVDGLIESINLPKDETATDSSATSGSDTSSGAATGDDTKATDDGTKASEDTKAATDTKDASTETSK
ncbi:foldase protein PrsA [Paenibacillus cellulosilyticus]|uniref:Foldase protein PrsA n=1 Tax=Paenibacillus cellulosilyticus TaxID=375489 RepID=A0A2V2YRJ5_9BACL|nr:peptidylprolyl isomerase [Paenibacillus cellulosilyticus]PWV95969.1 foldase protein PrsA [Paenibacillus cellulosilyticus]QKS48437.1 peptidylprolyl isomerase [Paenibacillus cellulosilyticus]